MSASDSSEIAPSEIDACKAALGGLYDRVDDPRLVRPLVQQVEELMRLIASHHPQFRRSIPVHWSDTDELIPQVIVRLLREVERLRAEIGRLNGFDPGIVPGPMVGALEAAMGGARQFDPAAATSTSLAEINRLVQEEAHNERRARRPGPSLPSTEGPVTR